MSETTAGFIFKKPCMRLERVPSPNDIWPLSPKKGPNQVAKYPKNMTDKNACSFYYLPRPTRLHISIIGGSGYTCAIVSAPALFLLLAVLFDLAF